jgi:diguanylate cyclase (GGDEF)-like protein
MKGSLRAFSTALGHARRRVVTLALIGLVLVLGLLVYAIASSQDQTRARLISSFELRGTASATFVSTFLSEQAARERQTGERFLSGRRVPAERFAIVASAFGSGAALLLDTAGRVLDVVPSDARLLGRPIGGRYAHLSRALSGRITISNVVPSAVRGVPVAAIAVPFPTRYGRRVLSVAYRGAGSALGAFVDHTISYSQHEVFLVDGTGRLIAASPATGARTLAEADPALARSARRASDGRVTGAGDPSTFTVAPVAGTPWRLLIEVPNSRLYASITAWTLVIPWLVFALVSILGMLLVGLLARLHADRRRLTELSRTLEQTARTDELTGLLNRRALTEELARAAAQARRRGESLSVLMIDLDRFKETNDRFGHDAGDRVLRTVAGCMRDVLRGEDAFGRWGGDEFLVSMWATNEREARAVGERLRTAAASRDLNDIGLETGVRMSVGAAMATAEMTPEEIVRAADLDLYRAKAEGAKAMGVEADRRQGVPS